MVSYHTDIFPFNIMVASVKELPQLKEDGFQDLDGEELSFPDYASGVTIKAVRKSDKGTASYSVLLFKNKPSVDTMAHEAFHAACDLLENAGVMYHRFESNETFAYLVGYITGCINDAVNKDKIWE